MLYLPEVTGTSWLTGEPDQTIASHQTDGLARMTNCGGEAHPGFGTYTGSGNEANQTKSNDIYKELNLRWLMWHSIHRLSIHGDVNLTSFDYLLNQQ